MNDIEKENLTIKEVADLLGISRQAVYSKLDKEFKPYLTIKNGKKLLNKAAFLNNKEKEMSIEVDKNIQSLVNLLDKQNEQLRKELDIKNEQIRELNARLSETTAALVTSQQTAQAAQALHAGTIRQQIESGGEDPGADDMQLKKPGFFSRLFGKKR